MTLTDRPLGAVLRTFLLLLGLLALAVSANAACSTPIGAAGDMTYSTSANVMAYCDGTNWVSMAGGVSLTVNTTGGGGTATPAGSANDVQFNNGSNLAADTGNFTYSSGLLTTPNINTGNVSATTVNATGLGTLGSLLVAGGATVTGQASLTVISTSLIQVGNNGASCTSGLAGGIRYATSNTLEYCNGSSWGLIGNYTSGTLPTLRVRMSAQQTGVTAWTQTKVHLNNVAIDTTGAFDASTNYRFTPKVAGNYLVTGQLACANASCKAQIYRNGSPYLEGSQVTGTGAWSSSVAATLVPMNGTTDYIELWGYTGGTTFDIGGNGDTELTAFLITGGGSGGGGTANPAGTTGDIQFNTGGLLDADTGNLYWDKTNHRLGIGTNAPSTALTISNTGYLKFYDVGALRTYRPVTASNVDLMDLSSDYLGTDVPVFTVRGNGYVGIGFNSPTTSLQVSGTATMNMANLVSQSFSSLSGAGGNKIVSGSASVTAYSAGGVSVTGAFQTASSALFDSSQTQINGGRINIVSAGPYVVYADTDVGSNWQVGNANGNFTFYYNNTTSRMSLTSGGILTVVGTSTCTIGNGTGTTSCTSDRRLKQNIHPISSALEKLELLNGVTYHWKDPSKSVPEHIGLIAQDVEKVFPQAVDTVSDSTLGTAKTVDYAVLIAPAIEAIKELKADNDNLRAQMKAANDNATSLRTQLDDVNGRLQRLENEIKKK